MRVSPPLIIRCDGGTIRTSHGPQNVASGHLMRMLNIAKYWRNTGNSVILVTHQHNLGIESYLNRYREIECNVEFTHGPFCDEDVEELISIIQRWNASLVYLDGYHFFSHYQRAIHERGIRLCMQDDSGTQAPYFADIIVGSHVHAPDIPYNALHTTRLLLGTEYALIGMNVVPSMVPRKVSSHATQLLITLGGSDVGRYTEKCLRGLLALPENKKINDWLNILQVTLVIGADNPFGAEIEKQAIELSQRRSCLTRVLKDVHNISQIMQNSDLAYSAAGGTLLELLCLGIPTVLQVTHPFHIPIAQKLSALMTCVLAGNSSEVDHADISIGNALFELAHNRHKRQELSDAGRSLVDGKGVERVCQEIRRLLESR